MKALSCFVLFLILGQDTPPGPIVEGQVLQADNAPAAGMIVELLGSPVNDAGTRRWPPALQRTTTDERGHFRIAAPATGTYFLRALQKPAPAGMHSIRWLPTTYFNGVLNGALASPLLVQNQNASVTLTIPQANPYTVSGKVTSGTAEQSDLPEIRLILMRRDFGAPDESSPEALVLLNLSAGSDGTFEIHEVPSGSYALLARTGKGDQIREARYEFDISDRDIDNVALEVQAGRK